MKTIGLTPIPSPHPIPIGLIWDGAVIRATITTVIKSIGGIIDMAGITKGTGIRVTRGATGMAGTASNTEGTNGPATTGIRIHAKSSDSIKKGPRNSPQALFTVQSLF